MQYLTVKAKPEEVTQHWHIIGNVLKEAAPEYFLTGPESLNNALQAILKGNMQCWIAMTQNGASPDPYGVILTYPTSDACTGAKNLLVVCIASFGTNKPDPRMYVRGLDTLKKFAKGIGCKNVIAYTRHEKLAKFVEERLGGDAGQRLISISVEDNDG